MREKLDDSISRLKPDDHLEASRFLNEVKENIKALQDPNIGHQFNDWKPKGAHVAELVRHMREKGLQFAPASSDDDRAAYLALYHALTAFDQGMAREIGTNRGGADNK